MRHTLHVYAASSDVIDFTLETDFGDDASDSDWVGGLKMVTIDMERLRIK